NLARKAFLCSTVQYSHHVRSIIHAKANCFALEQMDALLVVSQQPRDRAHAPARTVNKSHDTFNRQRRETFRCPRTVGHASRPATRAAAPDRIQEGLRPWSVRRLHCTYRWA